MRSILIVSACALALGFTSPASAQHRHYHHHSNGGWAAPLVGGLIVGGMLGAMANQPRYYANPPVVIEQYPPRQYCRREVVGRDYYGNLVIENVCRYE
jgi:hypothetical protein